MEVNEGKQGHQHALLSVCWLKRQERQAGRQAGIIPFLWDFPGAGENGCALQAGVFVGFYLFSFLPTVIPSPTNRRTNPDWLGWEWSDVWTKGWRKEVWKCMILLNERSCRFVFTPPNQTLYESICWPCTKIKKKVLIASIKTLRSWHPFSETMWEKGQ